MTTNQQTVFLWHMANSLGKFRVELARDGSEPRAARCLGGRNGQVVGPQGVAVGEQGMDP